MGTYLPRYEGRYKIHPLLTVCTKQWKYCVEKSLNGLDVIPPQQRILIKYEDFATNPSKVLKKIIHFIQFSDNIDYDQLEKPISSDSIGKYKNDLSANQINYLEETIRGLSHRLDYQI